MQKTSTDDLLQQQIEQQIAMETKCIDQLQEEENQWFQHSRTARDEVFHLAERARRLINQDDQYTTTIGTALDTLHDEPLELKLQYLIEIKASTTSIIIVVADWHAFKCRVITNAPAILTSDGPLVGTTT